MIEDREAVLQRTVARAQRADAAWEEFFGPMIAEMETAYSDRMIEVATTELNPAKRADMLTALANALKIAKTLKAAMHTIVKDGEVAFKEIGRTDRIENMTAPKRKLLRMGSGY